MTPDSFVFIITYGRSGSTLLQNTLNAMPGYQIRGENGNALFHLFEAWRVLRTTKPLAGPRASNLTTLPSHPYYGAELVNPAVFGRRMAKTFTQTVLNPDPDVRTSGFKEIRFIERQAQLEPYLDFMFRFFPNTKFLFNTRDHIEVAASSWWQNQPADQVHQKLTQVEARFDRYLQKHPERGIKIHYNDYINDPAHLDPVFDFLGEGLDPQAVKRILGEKLTH